MDFYLNKQTKNNAQDRILLEEVNLDWCRPRPGLK